MKRFCYVLSLLWVLLLSSSVLAASLHQIPSQGVVVTSDKIASQVGADILKKGGNAIDAAVAVGFALAVTYPRAGNLGGGGVMLVHLADENKTIALDYREMAPDLATENMFQDKNGNVNIIKSRFSHHSAGVPGTVRGLEMALNLYGTMSLAEVMAPAIDLAKRGFRVSKGLRVSLLESKYHLRKNPEAYRTFYGRYGLAPEVGDLLVQGDLANTLEQIAIDGGSAFYEGHIADLIVQEMKRYGGLITKKDLKNYTPVLREPLRGDFKGYEIVSMPPPSSGGVHLIQMLSILDKFDLNLLTPIKVKHLMVEVMKLAYADRSKYLGDPDFVEVPVKKLLSQVYIDRLSKTISLNSTTPSEMISPGHYLPYESDNTTHYSIVDKDGNAVANTYTLNFSYGSGIMVEGAGFLLNNEMDDFSAKPGVPNAYGLLGGSANKIEPRKRPLTSMTPTMVFRDGYLYMITGSPGGSKIITSVLQVILNVLAFDMDIGRATKEPRIHHQWMPDEVRIENSGIEKWANDLSFLGHKIKSSSGMGVVHSILKGADGWTCAADERRLGASCEKYKFSTPTTFD